MDGCEEPKQSVAPLPEREAPRIRTPSTLPKMKGISEMNASAASAPPLARIQVELKRRVEFLRFAVEDAELAATAAKSAGRSWELADALRALKKARSQLLRAERKLYHAQQLRLFAPPL